MKNEVVRFITKELERFADQNNALAMAAYMKTTMPFYGVRAGDRRSISKLSCKKYLLQNQIDYLDIVQELWSQPYRELKYIAIDIARAYPHYINVKSLPLFKQMIKNGAWWDFVDDIAIHLVGVVLMQSFFEILPIIQLWINDPNLWLRRAAIICQNKFKDQTDEKVLFSFCLKLAHQKDFFIKKAIGWALREYSKTSPQSVQKFVQENKHILSQLSCKEALKRLE